MMTMITWWCLPIGILRDVWNVDRIVCNPPKSTSFGHPEKLCKADVRKLFGWLEDYVDLPNQRSRTAFELEIYFISFIFFLVCCFLYFFVDISHSGPHLPFRTVLEGPGKTFCTTLKWICLGLWRCLWNWGFGRFGFVGLLILQRKGLSAVNAGKDLPSEDLSSVSRSQLLLW